MRRVWKIALPMAVLLAVGGYAASSLAASDLEVTPRETIVIDEGPAPVQQDGDRAVPGTKDDERGDDRRTTDDDEDEVVAPDVDDLDDARDDRDDARDDDGPDDDD